MNTESKRTLLLLHINVRSLHKNFDYYEFIESLIFPPHVICLSETRIKKDPLINIKFTNYSFVHIYSKSNASGVAIYIRNSLNYEISQNQRLLTEVESRTQGSRPRPRPRTQKKSEAKAKAKDSLSEDRHSRGQGQECSRPRPRTKDTKRKCSPKKKKKKKKKVFTKIFQAISTKKRFPKNFSTAPQNFNIPKNSAVLEPRTGQFSRT